MEATYRLNCERVRASFEGREALYVEAGVLRVHISSIRSRPDVRNIDATLQEIPTPGLQPSLIHNRFFAGQPTPISWSIAAGSLSTFSEHTWAMGYGGWWLTTEPRLLGGVISLASTFGPDDTPELCYARIMEYLHEHAVNEQLQRVFPIHA